MTEVVLLIAACLLVMSAFYAIARLISALLENRVSPKVWMDACKFPGFWGGNIIGTMSGYLFITRSMVAPFLTFVVLGLVFTIGVTIYVIHKEKIPATGRRKRR